MKNIALPLLALPLLTLAFLIGGPVSALAQNPEGPDFRPPSVPLVVHDPYFSIWSPADKLTDAETVHWTGKKHPLHAMIRIDGKPYRLMGAEPADVPAMEQVGCIVFPGETLCVFMNRDVSVMLIFEAPIFPDDLDAMSRPATRVTVEVESLDGDAHDIGLYFDAGAEIAVNTPDQQVECLPMEIRNITALKVGTTEQNHLGKRGDDVRIDWGYLILAAPNDGPEKPNCVFGDGRELRNSFVKSGTLEGSREISKPVTVAESQAVIALCTEEKSYTNIGGPLLVIAYDDVYSIRYFGDDLKAWWARDGKTAEQMIAEAWEARLGPQPSMGIMADLTAVGGEDYARLCALAYRQSLGAQKLVADVNGMPLMISKENFSNGSAGTVDLMYPCSPLLLYYSPALMKATLQPMFDYVNTPKWKFPFAPHDLGTYPHATGQTYGGGETSEANQMPVEETANMILMTAALAVAENDPGYAKVHWVTLTRWADYLLDKGFDPENQLCTDDFAGHLAHNVNLSAKAIVAIGAYAKLADKLGERETAAKYRKAAEEFAARWIKEADDGDHFRLAFDRPGTWSMKYNLLWDELLDLRLFPRNVIDRELAFYKTKMQKYGLPLDNRSLYTKNDWILWTAAMTDSREDFDALVGPVIDFVNDTEQRVPLSDWYFTDTARQCGFQARSVVGGYWAPMLRDTEKWQAQAAKGANVPNTGWAEILLPGRTVGYILPTSQGAKLQWQYTEQKPADGWEQPGFDDGGWKTGPAGFGTRETPGAVVGTEWRSNDIWLRQTFTWNGRLDEGTVPAFRMHHDEDTVVYVNGKKMLTRAGWTTDYETVPIPALIDALKPGENTIAVHCVQKTGGQFIDVGISCMELKWRAVKETIATPPKQNTAQLNGTVTFDGVPIDGAVIAFYPCDGDARAVAAAIGLTDVEGRYSMTAFDGTEDIPVGEYKVTVAKLLYERTNETDDEGPVIKVTNVLPQKFGHAKVTPLQVSIQPGKNTWAFELTSN